MKNYRFFSILCALCIFATVSSTSCKNSNNDQRQNTTPIHIVQIPSFNSDSAYGYVKKQVDFGPRTPNSIAHKKCGNYLENKMKEFGADVTIQETEVMGFDGKTLHCKNIIASFNPKAATRILLVSHWDCRPWCDNDPNKKYQHSPVDGANDGASGVGILMEFAHIFGKKTPPIGVDILLTDMEDYGEPDWYKGQKSDDSWCLGTQYWAKTPHIPNYHAMYGILLDMVGAPNATFPKESFSMQYAPDVVNKIWSEANQLGYGDYFVDRQGGAITDDHIPINKIIGIPTIDIIQFNESGFAPYWHTHNDTMENIDKTTLNVVGRTLLNVIYKEQP